MKLNIGCGKQTWDGFFCVDAVRHPKANRDPDLFHAFKFDKATLVNPLPLEDGVASELHSYHFLEHVYAWEAPALLNEFKRLLKPQGVLILELPDIALAAKNLIRGLNDQMVMWPLYGNPDTNDPYMTHRWGYTPSTLKALLSQVGFKDMKSVPPRTHNARLNRDMRMEARKPE
jgi:predicted SAM-dependent methyltransferase